jgi:hypothetical protein
MQVVIFNSADCSSGWSWSAFDTRLSSYHYRLTSADSHVRVLLIMDNNELFQNANNNADDGNGHDS